MACEHCTHKCLCIHPSLVLSSGGASFYKVMVGDFSSQLEIPAEFVARMNFRVFKYAILTGPSGHLWHVKFCCTGVSASFRDGWEGFVTDNHIKAKDILVFRHARDKYFVVQVFGVNQREHKQNDTMFDPKEEILSANCSQKSCEIKEIDSADSSTSTSGAVPDVGSSEVLAVPNPVKNMEPMFSLTLSKSATSTHFALTIPLNFGDRWLPNQKVELTFLHHKNPGEWRHMLGVYKGARRYGVCWKGFVIDNKLQRGDKCVFKLINGDKHIFMIYVNG